MPKAKKLPSGSWRCQVYLGKDENGKNIYKSVTADTRKEAEYLAAEMQLKKKEKDKSGLTLAEAYKNYIESKKNVLSPNTVREYKKASQRDLQELMPLLLSELTQERIQTAISDYALDHSAKSTANVHGLLSAVLRQYRPELSLHTRLPQKQKYERHIPSEEDIQKLVEITEGTRIHVPILLAAFGSFRRSEIVALKRSDVTDNGIWVKRAEAVDENRQLVTKATKTIAGYRFIDTIPEWVLQKVKAWDFNITLNAITKDFAKAVKRAEIMPCRFHDLRHFYASEQHALGIPDKYIMKQGGWSSSSILHDVYQHTIKEKQSEYSQQAKENFEKFKPKD